MTEIAERVYATITLISQKKTHKETSIINTVRFPCVSGASILRYALIRWVLIKF